MCGGGRRVKTFISINGDKFNAKSIKDKRDETCIGCHQPYHKHISQQAICPEEFNISMTVENLSLSETLKFLNKLNHIGK